jgi:hypothetical protein
MQKNHRTHWGKWIKRRSRYVGFRRHADFAAAIGCGAVQLSKWFRKPVPPEQMRKGFDAAMIRALKINRITFSVGYAEASPIQAPIIEPAEPPKLSGEEESLRRRVIAMAELLPFDALRELANIGGGLLLRYPPAA